jgi:hypothetical protein
MEVVKEFDTILHSELDLVLEAANGDQLRHNFPPKTPRGELLMCRLCTGITVAAPC